MLPSTARTPRPSTSRHQRRSVAGEAPVEPSPPRSRPEAHTDRDAVPPAVSDIDILPAPPSESVDNSAQADALESEVSALDERIWRDTPEAQQTAAALAVDAAAQIIDMPPPVQQPAPIREEQIWSGPQAIEPSLQWPSRSTPTHSASRRLKPMHAPSRNRSTSGTHRRPHLSRALRHRRRHHPWFHRPWRQPGHQRRFRHRRPAGWANSSAICASPLRMAGGAVLALTAAVLLLVVLYRWVDPPAST